MRAPVHETQLRFEGSQPCTGSRTIYTLKHHCLTASKLLRLLHTNLSLKPKPKTDPPPPPRSYVSIFRASV